jgi:hypothetical protein
MPLAEPVRARYGPLYNLGMAAIEIVLLGAVVVHFAADPARLPKSALADPGFMLFAILAAAMAFYAYVGISRSFNRAPQVVIDRDGIALGFGRDCRFAWSDVEWVRLRRLALRPQLQVALLPEAFVAADLRLSPWSFDDALRPLKGVPAGVLVRDNGLDTRASAMFEAVRAFRPNLVKS